MGRRIGKGSLAPLLVLLWSGCTLDAAGPGEPAGLDEKLAPLGGALGHIECDGKGGLQVHISADAPAQCGFRDCVRSHEEVHVRDHQANAQQICAGKAAGEPAYIEVGALTRSECNAYTDTVSCLERKAQEHAGDPGCKSFLAEKQERARQMRDSFCNSSSAR
jgi:hypothetical protein